MPRHITSCHAMPCHAMPYHIMSCHATPRHVTSCHAMPSHPMPRHITSCHAISHHITSCYATPRHAMPRHTTPCHATPRHATPHHAMISHDATPRHVSLCLAMSCHHLPHPPPVTSSAASRLLFFGAYDPHLVDVSSMESSNPPSFRRTWRMDVFYLVLSLLVYAISAASIVNKAYTTIAGGKGARAGLGARVGADKLLEVVFSGWDMIECSEWLAFEPTPSHPASDCYVIAM